MNIPVSGTGMPPKRSSEHAAGADLFAVESFILAPGERRTISTGLSMAIPAGYVGLVWPRSGLALKHGIDTMAGVVDSDYRGEVKVLLINHGKHPFKIQKGDRIAQMLIQKVESANYRMMDVLPGTRRGEKGFGSTGR